MNSKPLLFLILFLCFQLNTIGQTFQETILSSNFTDPYTLKVIDLDSNGHDDIIVCGASELSWFKNLNGLSYDKVILFDSVTGVLDFDLVDYDADLDMDIVAITANSIFWLENTGNSNFVYHSITNAYSSLRKVRALDMDNDGDVDIVYSIATNFIDIYLYEKTSTGFTNTYIDRVDYSGIYLLDYNNDTCYDLITKTNYYPFTTEELAIMINNGSNVFTEQQIYEKVGDINISDIDIVDVNKNGTIDLLISDFVQQEIYFLENCTLRRNVLSNKKVRDAAVADFDNDGKNDIAYKEENSSTFRVHFLKGAGSTTAMTFTDLYYYVLDVASTSLTALHADNNTLPDIAFVSIVRDEVGYFKNDSNFTFSLKKMATAVSQPESMRRVDLDQDGDLDIVSIGSDAEIVWLDHQPDGSYKQKIVAGGMDNVKQIEVYDIDGDGYRDIISTSSGNGKFIIWYNDGNQNFTSFNLTSSHSVLSTPSFFSIVDLNNDNKKDFVIVGATTSSYNPKGIFWIRNDGLGVFSAPIAIQSNLNLMGEVVTFDFDYDGDQDIIVANHEYGNTGLKIIKNNNNATSFTISTFTSFRAVSIRMGDIDSDGLMDFVCRNDDVNNLVWFKNNGSMSFTPNTIVMNEDRDIRFEICDDGNDSITDIFFYESYYGFTNASNHNAGLLKNDGSENFTQTYYIQNILNILSAMPEDVDNDGDMDFFLGVDYSDKISFFENLTLNMQTPTVFTWPNASNIIYGDSLGESTLSGDSASVPGVFVFDNPSYIPNAGIYAASVTFYPNQDTVYSSVSGQVSVLVEKAEPVVYQWPIASNVEYNQPLSTSVLSGGSASAAGVFQFSNPTFIPPFGSYTADIIFFPNDSNNYDTVSGTVNVLVVKANPIISQWPQASTLSCGELLGSSVLSGGSANIAGDFSFDSLSLVLTTGIYSANITFKPNDTAHYNLVFGTVNVNVIGLDTTVLTDYFCNGTSYNFLGTTLNSAGVYYHVLNSVNSNCDSVVQLNLMAYPNFFIPQSQNICVGSTYFWHGQTYSAAGVYYDSLQTVNGCDSVFQLTLNVNPTYFYQENQTICINSGYSWHGQTYSAAGVYYDSLQTVNGCDSVFQLTLNVNPTYFYQESQTICANSSYFWHGQTYSAAGVYYDSLQTVSGCDSVFQLTLNVNPTYFYQESQTICANSSYFWHGQTYSSAGVYYDSLQTVNGCDSVYKLTLNVSPNYFYQETQTICDNSTYTWHGQTYSAAGVYYDSLQTVYGCDSVYKLTLNVSPNYFYQESQTICANSGYFWHGQTYSLAGVYYDSLQTVNGCDSVFQLALNVSPTYFFQETQTICDNSTYAWHGQTYSAAGVYYDSLQTVSGCDSVFQLTLNVSPNYFYQENQTICANSGYFWHGQTYSAVGIYYDSLQTMNGCDSVFQLTLSHFPAVNVVLNPFNPDSVCQQGGPVNLPVASPLGGVFSGNGVTGAMFDPTAVSLGIHWVFYTYTDTNSCQTTATTSVTVLDCSGIEDFDVRFKVDIFPNPNDGLFTVRLPEMKNSELNFSIFNSLGVEVYVEKFETKSHTMKLLDLREMAKGVYYVQITNSDGLIAREKVVVR